MWIVSDSNNFLENTSNCFAEHIQSSYDQSWSNFASDLQTISFGTEKQIKWDGTSDSSCQNSSFVPWDSQNANEQFTTCVGNPVYTNGYSLTEYFPLNVNDFVQVSGLKLYSRQ